MDSKTKNWIIIIVVAVIIIAGIFFWINQESKPSRFDDFAKCLKDKGAIFYGTFWCSHCQNQKALFGKSAKYLPYTECSTADSNGQLQVCKDANITSYPTWQFADASRTEGEISLEALAEKTTCVLP